MWSQALKGKNDLTRFKALGWGLRTWDLWSFNDCDSRFGDEWPDRIPTQLIAHILGYFSKQGNLVFDPMARGGVYADICLAMGRKCWSLDMDDRPVKTGVPGISGKIFPIFKEEIQEKESVKSFPTPH